MKPLALVLVAVFALAGCSADGPAERTPRACFLPSDVERWGAVDALHFWVETDRGDVYAGRLDTICPTADWSNQIAIQPSVGRLVCPGQEVRLIVPDRTTRTEICYVQSLELVTPEEGARLQSRAP